MAALAQGCWAGVGAAPNSLSAEWLCHTWVLGKDPQSHRLGSAGTSILQVQHHTVCQHHLSSHPGHVEEMRCCSWSRKMVSAPLHPGSNILGLSITRSSPSSKVPCCQPQIYKGPLVSQIYSIAAFQLSAYTY